MGGARWTAVVLLVMLHAGCGGSSGGGQASSGGTGRSSSGGTVGVAGAPGTAGAAGTGAAPATGGAGGMPVAIGTSTTTTPGSGSGGAGGGPADAGSSDGGDAGGHLAPTFTQLYQTIFLVSCAGAQCHDPGTHGGISFASRSSAYAAVSGRVTPGNVSDSSLYTIVQSGRMPPGTPKLTAAQVSEIAAWITDGAPND